MRSTFQIPIRLAVIPLLVLASATCSGDSTAPSSGHGAELRVRPAFTAAASQANLPIDHATVTVVRAPSETLAVKDTAFVLADTATGLAVPLDLLAPSESLLVGLELRNGPTALARGTAPVEVMSGTPPALPAPIAVAYVGPGADITLLHALPADSVLSFGDTLRFHATATNGLGQPVAPAFLTWASDDPATLVVGADGHVTGPDLRATRTVRAQLPNGVQATTTLALLPRPRQLVVISGDGQVGAAGDTLAAPLVVEVRGADTLPIPRVRVVFAVAMGGGDVVTDTVLSDSLGRARSRAVLGPAAGGQAFTATAAGIQRVFSATAIAGAPTAIARLAGNAQSDTTGQALPQPLAVKITDANGNVVAGAGVHWTLLAGDGMLSADSTATDSTGTAAVGFTLGAPGADTIRAQIAGTSAYVDFQVTSVVGQLDVVVISGDAQSDTVGQTLPESLVVVVRTAITAVPVPGRMVHFIADCCPAGRGIPSADSVLSDANGRAAVALTLGGVAGPFTVSASSGGSTVASFHLTALPGSPAQMGLTVAPPDTVAAASPFVPQPVVQLRDGFGNAVHRAGFVIRARTDSVHARAAGGTNAVTDTLGRATFAGLYLDGTPGQEVLHFETDTVAVGSATDTVTVVAGAPAAIVVVQGDSQVAFVDSLVAIAPGVRVVDGSGNGLVGYWVTFTVTQGGGTVTGTPTTADSTGLATVGSWRLGASVGQNTLEAQVAGLPSAVFTATGKPLTPGVILTLLNANFVPVGRAESLEVRLSTPAPALGVDVGLTSSATGVATVSAATLHFAAGDSIAFVLLNGIATGTADILGSAAGYDPDTLTVLVSDNQLSVADSVLVPLGQTAPLTVYLNHPAPAGGVVVTVSSLDLSKISPTAPTVTVPAGDTSAVAMVSGVGVGSAAIVVSNADYLPDTVMGRVTAALDISASTLTAYSTLGGRLTTQLRGGGTLVPAPVGGIGFSYTSRDPACVAAPATGTIAEGASATSDSLSFGGGAPLPCVTYVVVAAPGIDADSVQVTMNAAPAITFFGLPNGITVGSGLVDGTYEADLGTAAHGGRLLSLRTLTPGVALLQPLFGTPGTDTISHFLPDGTTSYKFFVAGLEGLLHDTVFVEASAPGFVPDTVRVVVLQTAIQLNGVPATTDEVAADSKISVSVGYSTNGTGLNTYQWMRPGGTLSRLATVRVTSDSVATIRDSTATPDTVKTVSFAAGARETPTGGPPLGLGLHPLRPGTATISASLPGALSLTNATRTMVVQAASLQFVDPILEVGSGLQIGLLHTVRLSGPNHGDVAVTFRLARSGVALLQPNATSVGDDSLVQTVLADSTNAYYTLAGLEGVVNDTVDLIASAPGFIPDTMKVVVRQPAVELYPLPATISTVAPDTTVYVQVGLSNGAGTALGATQGPRFGGSIARLATVHVLTPATAALRDTSATADSVKSVTIPIGLYFTQPALRLHPLAAGTATLTADIPGFLTLPTSTRTVTITTPGITMLSLPQGLGSGLQHVLGASLGATQHGGVNVVVRSSDPTLLRVAPDSATAGTDSIIVFVPNGSNTVPYFVQGMEGQTGSATISVSAPGFTTGTVPITVVMPAIELLTAPPDTLASTASSVVITAAIGVPDPAMPVMAELQALRAGGGTGFLPVTFTNSTTGVAQLVTFAGPGDTASVRLSAKSAVTPSLVTNGGVEFDPLAAGITTVTVSASGFIALPQATKTVNVTP